MAASEDRRAGSLLPIPATPLIGREREVAQVVDWLRLPGSRLATLTGPGGAGKTRLAIQIAAVLDADFAGGGRFIPLAPIRDPNLVLPAIAQGLGVQEAADRPLLDTLSAELRGQSLLLVLDNFEQVLPAAAAVAGLLAAAPRVEVLVTSRAALHLYGEHEFPIPPLTLPDGGSLVSPEQVTQSEAAQLFIARARAANPAFELSAETAPAVAEICRRLDGLPLALELAAARSKLLPPAALLARLDRRLPVLTGGARDLPARHQTLRGALAWSYDLLDAAEQALFRRLGVFVGGWTLEAAEAVASTDDPASTNPASVLEGLSSLLDKSLLGQEIQADGEPRFGMLETIREYAGEQLAASGEAEAIRLRHAQFFVALAEQAEPELTGPRQRGWFDRLAGEHDNLRAVLGWTLDRGDAEEVELASRLAGAIWRFWSTRGHLSEGRRWLGRCLDGLAREASVPAGVRAKVMNAAANLAWVQGDRLTSRDLYTQAQRTWQTLGDTQGVALTTIGLASVAYDLEDNATARRLYGEALDLCRAAGMVRGQAVSLTGLAVIALNEEDAATARRLQEEALPLVQALNDRRTTANALKVLAFAVWHEGAYAAARAFALQSVAIHVELANQVGLIEGLEALGAALGQQGEPARAAQLFGAVEAARDALGAPRPPSDQRIHDRFVRAARAHLAPAAWDTAWAEGYALSLDAAVALAQQAPAEVAAPPPAPAPPVPVPPAPVEAPAASPPLSAREIEVLRLVAAGLTNPQIAEQLSLSPRTVQAHLYTIYGKLGVATRSAATRYALDHHLVSEP